MTGSNKGVLRPLTLRACAMAALAASPAAAQTAEPEEVQLGTLKIEDRTADVSPFAQKGAPYKARTSGDARHTRPLAETPQTIAVLTRTRIEDSGQTDMAKILEAQPGITLGTGENGNAFGDRYIIRGQEAKSDVFVDGLRDPGMTIRESFAIEQIEIAKGPNSSFAGRGTSGGAINAITKAASTDYDFGKASFGIGSDAFVRATGDLNLRASDSFAVRGNVLYAFQDVPGRAPADRTRKGLALSALWQPDSKFSLTVDYYGLRAKDKPDLGGYLATDASGARVPQTVPVYAQDGDFLTSRVDTVTGRMRYQFSPDVFVTNIVRYGAANNAYVTTGAAGRTAAAGYATSVLDAGHSGWQQVRYLADQLNLHVNGDLLGGRNELIVSGEYTRHRVDSGAYARLSQGAFNCRIGATAVANDAFCITDAAGQPVANLASLSSRVWRRGAFPTRQWQVETLSASVMDTVDLTPRLTLFAGGRLDHFTYRLTTRDGTSGAQTAFYDYADTLWNGHAGISYKAGPAMFYLSMASAADINGGESDTGTSSGYGGLVVFAGDAAGAKPERSLSYEAGVKLNLFDEKLLVTAAAFQTTKSDVMEGADYATAGTFNTGKLRVRGLELGVAGNLTDKWSIQGGITLMDAKVLESANVGLSAAQLALGATNVGKTLANFAKFQAEVQTRYRVTEDVAIGGAVRHKSRRYGGQPDTAAVFTQTAGGWSYSQPVPAYTVGDAFVEWSPTPRLDVRLAVNNLADTSYYTAVYRSGTFLYKGDGRSVTGTVSVKF